MAPKTLVVTTETDPAKTNVGAKFIGGFSLLLFLSAWLLSASSPFLFVLSLSRENYSSALFIFAVTVVAHTPWKDGGGAIRKFYTKYAHQYVRKTKIVFEGDKPSSKKDPHTFYAIHPHGAYSIGWAFLYVHDPLSHVRFCFSPILFASPFFRLFSRLSGKPGSAAKLAMIQYLKKGESLALPPGGFEEASITSLNHDRVFIKKRTGFVKLCLQHGTAIRPVYVFGEKGCYWNIQGGFGARLALNRYGIPAILAFGNPLCPLLPKPNAEIHIVVGEHLVLPKIEQPTKEDVFKWHQKYITSLTKLFEDHKEEAYGAEAKTMKLEVW